MKTVSYCRVYREYEKGSDHYLLKMQIEFREDKKKVNKDLK